MTKPPYYLFFLTVFAVVLFSHTVYSSDRTADSCSASAIQSAIDSCMSSGGGTVTIPSCDYSNSCSNGSCWAGSQSIEVDADTPEIKILGQGVNNTKISYQAGNAVFLRGTAIVELGQLTLDAGLSGGGAFKAHGIEDCRIHNMTIKNYTGSNVLCGTSGVVIDNCTIGPGDYTGSDYHWYVYGDNTYTDDWSSNFGTNNYNVFFEDNTFEDGVHHPISTFTGGTVVARYNTFNWSSTANNCTGNIDAHEPGYGDCGGDNGAYNWDPWDTYIDGSQPEEITHGGQAYEIYNNTWNWTGSEKFGYAARIRSGSTIFTANTLNANNYPSNYIDDACRFVCDNKSKGARCTSAYGFPLDITWHESESKAVCFHSTDGCCDKPFGSYVWGNIMNGANNEVTSESPCGDGSIVEGIDYFNRAPTQGADGFTWTPYEYPHPLRNGTEIPAAPTGLKIKQ